MEQLRTKKCSAGIKSGGDNMHHQLGPTPQPWLKEPMHVRCRSRYVDSPLKRRVLATLAKPWRWWTLLDSLPVRGERACGCRLVARL
jgi:hypothetical protein